MDDLKNNKYSVIERSPKSLQVIEVYIFSQYYLPLQKENITLDI